MEVTRLHLRSFWCIRAAIAIIDNTSIYDKIIYPSQAFNLPIKDYDEKHLGETISAYDFCYKQKLFQTWKKQYIAIRNQKAKVAFGYVKTAFAGWKQWKDKSVEDKCKIRQHRKKWDAKFLENVWEAMAFKLKQSVMIKEAEHE